MNRLQSHPKPPESPLHPARNLAHAAHLRAGNHIRYAAEIISDAMACVPETDHQLYDSIVGALCTLERHLNEMNQILEIRNRDRANRQAR